MIIHGFNREISPYVLALFLVPAMAFPSSPNSNTTNSCTNIQGMTYVNPATTLCNPLSFGANGTFNSTASLTASPQIILNNSNIATINNGGYTDTFSGNIVGPGNLTLAGSGTTILNGNIDTVNQLFIYSTVSADTLIHTGNNVSMTGNIISGVESINVGQASTLRFVGANPQTISAANVGNAGNMELGANSSLNVTGKFTNSGSLYGTGTLNGDLINTGNVSAGSTSIIFSGANSNRVIIAPLAQPIKFMSPLAAAALTATSNASVSSSMTVNGNLTLQSVFGVPGQTARFGTLSFNIHPSDNTQLIVNGTTQLSGGDLFVQASGMSLGPGNKLRTIYTLLQSSNPDTNFYNVDVHNLAFGQVYDLIYVTNGEVLLSVYPQAWFNGMAQTANETEVGAVLDSAVPNATGSLYNQLNSLYQLPSNQLAAAMNQLDGEIYADAPNILYNAVSDTWAPVYARMGLSATQGGALPANAPHVWMSGVGNFGGVQGNGNADGYSQHTGGFLVGADSRLLEGLNTGLTAGYVYAGAGRYNAGSTLSAQMWQLGGYADMNVGDAGHIGLLLGYTQGPLNFNNPSVLGNAGGQTYARLISAETRAAWQIDFGGGHSLTPILSLQTVYEQITGLSESGLGALSLNVPTQNTTMVAARFQTRYDYNWRAWGADWTASAAIGLREMLNQPDANASLNYSGIAGQNFTVQGVVNNSSIGAGLVNVGLTTHLNDALNVEVGYRGTYSGNTAISAFQGNLVWKFDQDTTSSSADANSPSGEEKAPTAKKPAENDNGEDKEKLDIRTPGSDLANFPNSAYTLPRGGFYLEMAPYYYIGNSSLNPSLYETQVLLRYGLIDNIELRLFYYGFESQAGSSGNSPAMGSGPLVFDTKIHLWDEWKDYLIPALGFEAQILTPWLASPALSSPTQPTFSFNFDQSLPWDIAFEYNLGAGYIQNPLNPSLRTWQFMFQWSVQRDITDNLAFFINGSYNGELLVRPLNYSTSKEPVSTLQQVCGVNANQNVLNYCQTTPVSTYKTITTTTAAGAINAVPNVVGAGLIWTLNDNLALYANAGVGTNTYSPAYQAYAGFAWTP
ncbi:autotransporter domain-containing protein [Candidatus Methylospira mobilis]|uniref:Autotransporter domain-containing protein n=2 Tax=Candidatus Methylospira mobilis TaxID=1808979 RepID=A0A5Q0BJ16_9GAMM|nr:autotransporter domain-containing protein [Candidatus Methylospira mobilis]